MAMPLVWHAVGTNVRRALRIRVPVSVMQAYLFVADSGMHYPTLTFPPSEFAISDALIYGSQLWKMSFVSLINSTRNYGTYEG